MQQRPCRLVAVQQGIGPIADQPAIWAARELPMIGGHAIDDKAGVAAAKNDAVARRDGAIPRDGQRGGAQQMSAAIAHQGLMFIRFHQSGNGLLAGRFGKSQHFIAAGDIPQLADGLAVSAVGQGAIMGDQVSQSFAIFEQLHARGEALQHI